MELKDRIKVSDVGYNYIEVSPREILNWGGFCVCNRCNGQFLDENMYLIFVLADTYCKDCFNKSLKEWKTLNKEEVAEDLELQDEQSLNWYKYHLDSTYRDEIEEERNKQNEKFYKAMENLKDLDFEDIFTELDKE